MSREKVKITTVEIQTTNTTGKFTFPNDNLLNGKTIVGIFVPDNTTDDLVAPSGRPVVPNDAVNAAVLDVKVNGNDSQIYTVPLKYFQENSGDRQVRKMFLENVNPGTSTVTFNPDPVSGNQRYDTTDSVLLVVEYID